MNFLKIVILIIDCIFFMFVVHLSIVFVYSKNATSSLSFDAVFEKGEFP